MGKGRETDLNVSIKSLESLKIDTPTSISVKDVCSAHVSVLQITGHYDRPHSSATANASVHWSTSEGNGDDLPS